jgi:tartrate/fumarate subfamily iron-sulfur-dependent hydro-lyase beta chain
MEHYLKLPLTDNEVKNLKIGDIIYLSGTIFTARDEAHHMMLHTEKLPFEPSEMGLYHCGPLMKKTKKGWQVISAGPTTSSRMEIFEDEFLKRFNIKIIIGKGGMGEKTQKALRKYICVYTSYTGGAGALAADKVEKVKDVYWYDKLGMPEAVWIFDVKEYGPLVVAMDAKGNSIYRNMKV